MQGMIAARGARFQLSLPLEYVGEEMAVRVGAVRRITGMFLSLQRIAVEHVDGDLTDRVRPGEQIPLRQRRRGCWAKIREHQAAELTNRIGFDLQSGLTRRLLHR